MILTRIRAESARARPSFPGSYPEEYATPELSMNSRREIIPATAFLWRQTMTDICMRIKEGGTFPI